MSEDTTPCPLCESPAFLLGILGRSFWWRCRGCGHTFETSH